MQSMKIRLDPPIHPQMLPVCLYPPTASPRPGLPLRFAVQPPPPSPARPRPQPLPSRPLQPRTAYSLAHRKGAVHFAAAPIIFTRPERGVYRASVNCPTCRQNITVLVRSRAAVALERWKHVGYMLLVGLLLYAFAALIPWDRFFSAGESCVSLFALLAFGTVGLYNGAQVIASDAALMVDLPGKPFFDMLPSLTARGQHTILRK
jgi:hypothetical protein